VLPVHLAREIEGGGAGDWHQIAPALIG